MNDLSSNADHPANPLLSSDEPVAAVPTFTPPTGDEDETAVLFSQTPDDVPSGPETPRRIPHFGHALLFVSIAALILILTQALLLGLTRPPGEVHDAQKLISTLQPKLLVASMAAAYVFTLILSWFIFPLLWSRPFADGVQWNFSVARRNLLKLIPLGLALGWTVQALSSLIPVPKSIPMDDFFRTPSDVWLVTAFGTLLAPLFEEICFRGFLLPAFATAYDWLSLPRTTQARTIWHSSAHLTTPALVFSAIVTSILFALLHAEQLAHAWAALFVLFCVSLILTLVRIRTRSVACSALVHACYNLSVFLTLFIATGGYRHLDRMAR
jgi:membrane protease YdiL (CAAX protease family)